MSAVILFAAKSEKINFVPCALLSYKSTWEFSEQIPVCFFIKLNNVQGTSFLFLYYMCKPTCGVDY